MFFKAGITLLLLFGASIAVSAQSDSLAIKAQHAGVEREFEKIFSNMTRFFETKQKMVYQAGHEQSETGQVSYVIEYTCKKVSYELTSTDQKDVPYQAAISLNLSKRDNRSCGDTKGTFALGPPAGWNSTNKALEFAAKESCFKTTTRATLHAVDLIFSYKNEQWQFDKAVNQSDGRGEPQLTLAFGKAIGKAIQIDDEAALRFNATWLKLLSYDGMAKH